MKVFLIRHGQTKGNLEHRYVGSTDEDLLESEHERISQVREQYPKPDFLFASPLKRCVQTAELLYPEKRMETEPELQECEFGAFEYKNYLELQGNEAYQAWIDSGGTLAFPGGESRIEFVERCSRAFEKCCEQAVKVGSAQTGFVVHGGTIMAVLDQFSEPHRDYFDWQVKNTEGFMCELNWQGEKLRLTDIQKLPGE